MMRRRWMMAVGAVLAAAGCSATDGGTGSSAEAAQAAPGGAGGYYSEGASPSDPWAGSGTGGPSQGANAGIAQREDGPVPAPPNDGDKYEAVGTNPFVIASHDPQSTFAVDVDTASYDIFRRDVAQYDALPQADSVRLEEFVNYFAYDYLAPAADAATPFDVSLEAAASPVQPGATLLRVGIRGKNAPERPDQPANLVFLVDVSGSMSSSNKLPLVKTVLQETLTVLRPSDTVALVTYAGSTGVRLPPTPVSQIATIAAAIAGLGAGGGTAGAAGLTLAYEQAELGFVQGGLNHILLCSDGDFNVGPSSDTALVALVTEKRKTGITLTVLGFGAGNLNDSMMEKVSNAGNGIYGVIASEDQAIDYVNDRLLSTLYLIAKDVKIQVVFNPETVHAYRLLGYENRAIADDLFKDDTVDAGEIGSGHTVTALYEVVLTGGAIPAAEGAPAAEDGSAFDGVLDLQPEDLVRVHVRWKAVDATEADPASQVSRALQPWAVLADASEASADFRWAAGIAALAEVLKSSPYAHPGDLPAVRAMLGDAAGTDPDRIELLGLMDKAMALMQ